MRNHSQAYHNGKICLISFLSWLQLPTRGSDLESNSIHCLICTGDTVHNLLVNGDTSLSPQENISQLCSLLCLANHVYQKETVYLLIQVQPQNHFSKSSFFIPSSRKIHFIKGNPEGTFFAYSTYWSPKNCRKKNSSYLIRFSKKRQVTSA